MRFRALRNTRCHGAPRGAYVIPSLSKKQYRGSRWSERIEKGARREGEWDPGAAPAFYLPVLRLSNWPGTYVAEPQKYISRARIAVVCVEPMIIPASSGPRGALHCYYNETRINTSRRYVIGAITFLWWFSWPGRRGARWGERERWEKERGERDEAGRASSLGPEKLSEIMSEEIGSLARGWLTARSARPARFSILIPPYPPGIIRVLSLYSSILAVSPISVPSASRFFLSRVPLFSFPDRPREKPRSFSRRLSLRTER